MNVRENSEEFDQQFESAKVRKTFHKERERANLLKEAKPQDEIADINRAPSCVHGGLLKSRYFPDFAPEKDVPVIRISRREWCDLQLLGIGALSPLEGFMDRDNYVECVENMRLKDGHIWGIPITLSIGDSEYEVVKNSDEVYLLYNDRIWGSIEVEDLYRPDKQKEALLVYKTDSPEHPSVAYLKASGKWYVGGKIKLFGIDDFGFRDLLFTPKQTREAFIKMGWKRVAGFQTRNAPHRGHEYIQRVALEVCDGLFINPLVGETKSDDIPPSVVVRAYRILVSEYYRKDRVFLGVLPSAMRYGGPREAVHHAIIRKNFGCTHFIVGRDHAGYKNFYGPYDAHKIFENLDIGIEILFFEDAFWCKRCGGMTSNKICPHSHEERTAISGTQIRQMIYEGVLPPEEFMRKEISRVLIEYYRGLSDERQA